ncbi:hypothetical protein SmJEL517_g02674 [Synchytrium microbalum]|uniref:Autophagy-related protein 13 n=1 Tax=Synchytrium microbalum TaxID=1806994 RepID=A0A507BZK4_9FUNG|nr:uncharacterized protein SmJEL517_g02674 [Synchytrium microbalum]TPX34710.1 hypothetical protein SmJEL517_g02674 [Synchytrium microbalum]
MDLARTNSSYSNTASSDTASISSPNRSSQKAEQLIQQFYSKTAQCIVQARWTHPPPHSQSTSRSRKSTRVGELSGSTTSIGPDSARKSNKWFNLEIDELDALRDELKYWRVNAIPASSSLNVSSANSTAVSSPPLIIDLFLDLSNLGPAQAVTIRDEMSRRRRIPPEQLVSIDSNGRSVRKRTILLETWQLSLTGPVPSQPPELATVYKKAVMYFRSLYSFIRLMPSYRLFRRLKRSTNGGLGIGYRLSSRRTMPEDEAGLDQLHSTSDMRMGIAEYSFGTVDTAFGVFSLHVMYRLECDFSADDSEALLSSRLGDFDENYFSPRSLDSARDRRISESSRSRRDVLVERRVPEPEVSNLSQSPVFGSLPASRSNNRWTTDTATSPRGTVNPISHSINTTTSSYLPPHLRHNNSSSSSHGSPSHHPHFASRSGSPSPASEVFKVGTQTNAPLASYYRRSGVGNQSRRTSMQSSDMTYPPFMPFTPHSVGSLMAGDQDVMTMREPNMYFDGIDPPPFSTTHSPSIEEGAEEEGGHSNTSGRNDSMDGSKSSDQINRSPTHAETGGGEVMFGLEGGGVFGPPFDLAYGASGSGSSGHSRERKPISSSSSYSQSPSRSSQAPMVRRPSVVFPTSSAVAIRHSPSSSSSTPADITLPTLFTPGSSFAMHPGLWGSSLTSASPPPLVIMEHESARVYGEQRSAAGSFPHSSINNEVDEGSRSVSASYSTGARSNKLTNALARFQQLRDVNASFSASLNHLSASTMGLPPPPSASDGQDGLTRSETSMPYAMPFVEYAGASNSRESPPEQQQYAQNNNNFGGLRYRMTPSRSSELFENQVLEEEPGDIFPMESHDAEPQPSSKIQPPLSSNGRSGIQGSEPVPRLGHTPSSRQAYWQQQQQNMVPNYRQTAINNTTNSAVSMRNSLNGGLLPPFGPLPGFEEVSNSGSNNAGSGNSDEMLFNMSELDIGRSQ